MEIEKMKSWISFQTLLNAAFIFVIILLYAELKSSFDRFERMDDFHTKRHNALFKDFMAFEDRIVELERLAGNDAYELRRFAKYE